MDIENSECPINIPAIENFTLNLIQTILSSSFESHFCLAGGCYKSLIHNKNPNDIDLWPASEQDRLTLIKELILKGGKIEYEGEFNTVIRFQTFDNEADNRQSTKAICNENVLPCKTETSIAYRSGIDANFPNSTKTRDYNNFPRIEVTKKCPSSLEKCLAEFDLVLSCIGVELCKGKILKSIIHPEVQKDIANREVNLIKEWKLHNYNLLSLNRLHRYANELNFSVPQSTLDFLWATAYFNRSEKEKNDLLQSANLSISDVPIS